MEETITLLTPKGSAPMILVERPVLLAPPMATIPSSRFLPKIENDLSSALRHHLGSPSRVRRTSYLTDRNSRGGGNLVGADLHLDRALTTHGRIHANGLKTQLSHPLPKKCQFVGLGVEGSHNQNSLGHEAHTVVEVIFGASYHGIVPCVSA